MSNEVLQAEVRFLRAEMWRQQRKKSDDTLIDALIRFPRLQISQSRLRFLAEERFLLSPKPKPTVKPDTTKDTVTERSNTFYFLQARLSPRRQCCFPPGESHSQGLRGERSKQALGHLPHVHYFGPDCPQPFRSSRNSTCPHMRVPVTGRR